MKRRLLLIGGISAGVAALIAAATWLGGMSLSRRLDSLSAKAQELRMNLTLPTVRSNPQAERLRTEIDAFSDVRLPSISSGMSFFSEKPGEVRAIRKDIAPIVPKVFALSNCKSYGKIDWSDLNMVVLHCADYLRVEGNAAIINGDIGRLVATCSALRRILHVVPSDYVIGAAVVVLAAQSYMDLLQRGAFAADNSTELQLIIQEAREWKIKDFHNAAANLAAEEFLRIEQASNFPISASNPFEYAEELGWRTEPGKKKLKIFALIQGLEIYPKWPDDVRAWKAMAAGDLGVFDVIGAAKFLKLNELQLRRMQACLWATLHARKRQLEGGTWPTIDELEASSVDVRDPITGNLYEWREIDGRKRLYGKYQTHGDVLEENYLLVSDGEREREELASNPKK